MKENEAASRKRSKVISAENLYLPEGLDSLKDQENHFSPYTALGSAGSSRNGGAILNMLNCSWAD